MINIDNNLSLAEIDFQERELELQKKQLEFMATNIEVIKGFNLYLLELQKEISKRDLSEINTKDLLFMLNDTYKNIIQASAVANKTNYNGIK